MKREELQELGLEKEVIDKVFALHGQTLNAEKAKSKETIDALEAQLSQANEAISKASQSSESIENIQKELEEYKTKFEEATTTLAEKEKEYTIEKALTEAGVLDTDYIKFKLGNVEDITKLGELVTSLKEQYPNHFKSDDTESDSKDAEVIGNKLPKGESNKTFSMEEIAKLSTEEINEHWDIISQSLKNQ